MRPLGFLFFLITAAAQDWPQWRGPNRDGVSHAAFPAVWPKSLHQKWKTEVGVGYSSPVVAGGAVYVHTRQDNDEFVSRLDLATGRIAWRVKYAAPFEKNQYALQMSKGPHSTPVVAADRLYTFGVTSIVSCLDTRDGHSIWRKDFSKQIDTTKLFTGTAMSPILDSGSLIVHTGDDRGGSVIAFDAATGREKWTLKGDGPGYASPLFVDLDGARQLVTLTDRSIISVGLSNGKLLWSMPYKDEWSENIV